MTISTLANAQGSTVFTVEPFVNEGIVTVEVSYTDNVYIQAGGLDLVYDVSKLTIKEVKQSELMKTAMCVVNEKYAEDTVRLAWISTSLLPKDGQVVTFTFNIVSGEFENSDIAIENFYVGNKNGQILKDVTLSIKGVENSTIYSGAAAEDKKDDATEDKPATDSEAAGDETLPVDKAEDEKSADEGAEAAVLFDDVKDSDWFFDSVKFAKDNGLMGGVSETKFAPEEPVTRAMLVVILHRLEGTPEAGECEFADVAKGEWYSDGIAWAAEQGIVNGVSDAEFAPDSAITREQIAAIMYRYAQAKGVDVAAFEDTNILSFDDAAQISEYAIPAMQYACGSGLIGGKTATTINPQDNATRAEIATILMRYLK